MAIYNPNLERYVPQEENCESFLATWKEAHSLLVANTQLRELAKKEEKKEERQTQKAAGGTDEDQKQKKEAKKTEKDNKPVVIQATKFIKAIMPKDIWERLAERDSRGNAEDKQEAFYYIRNAESKIANDSFGAGKRNENSNTQGQKLQEELMTNVDMKRELKSHLAGYAEEYLNQKQAGKKNVHFFWDMLSDCMIAHMGDEVNPELSNFASSEDAEYPSRRIAYSVVVQTIRKFRSHPENYGSLLFLYFYVALYKKLPYVDLNAENYEKHYWDYRRHILETIGSYSLLGKTATYKMAEEGNTYCLYAKGQMLYYGQGVEQKRDIQGAYECYKKILEVMPMNPTALFLTNNIRLECIADYKQQDSSSYIEEIVTEYKEDSIAFYTKIVEELLLAFANGSAAAANKLGQLIQGDLVNGERVYRMPIECMGKAFYETPIYYFKESYHLGFPFAYINAYKYYVEQMQQVEGNEPDQEKQRNYYRDKALKCLKKGANEKLTAATNKLSRLYLKSYTEGSSVLLQDALPKDVQVAYDYAKMACDYAKLTSYDEAFTAYYNMLRNFYCNEKDSHFFLKSAENKIQAQQYLDVLVEVMHIVFDDPQNAKMRALFLKKGKMLLELLTPYQEMFETSYQKIPIEIREE